MQHYVIKFDSALRQISGFLRVFRFPSKFTQKTDITEILLKVSLCYIVDMAVTFSICYRFGSMDIHEVFTKEEKKQTL